MTPRKLKAEIRRRENKLSYQGPALDRRIRNQMKQLEMLKDLERWAKREWFECQLRVMSAEDELKLVLMIKSKVQTSDEKDL